MLAPVNIFMLTLFISSKVELSASLDIFGDIGRSLKVPKDHPLDSFLNFTEQTAKYGYTSEEHTVVTKDGYILSIFRIVKGKKCQGPIRSPPVLLMHGLLQSSDSWLDSGPESGLAYLIADSCYDLWAGNVRGNYYGKRHVVLNPETDIDFWQFSANEMGRFDLPATIDYILNYTSSEHLNYIGYSQGAGTYFIMCSERKGYSNKAQLFIGVEPVSRITNVKSLILKAIFKIYQYLQATLIQIGIYEAFPLGGILQRIAAFLCRNAIVANTLCRAVLSIIDSPHPGSIETKTIRVLYSHFPAGTSIRNMVYYAQLLSVDTFQNYDHGNTLNMELYNSTKPPAYNLSATTTPTVIINGLNDFLTVPTDVEWLTSHLPNVKEHYIVQDSMWNHFDVTYGKLTSTDILPKIVEYLDRYSKVVTNNEFNILKNPIKLG